MDSLFPLLPDAPRVYQVCEVTQFIRQTLEERIGRIWVEGEISNLRKQPSGHQYFTLKDEQCQLQCVLFLRQGLWRRPPILENGMRVLVEGGLSVYEARGQYQLNVQQVKPAGAGLLQARFEALKRQLAAEGLFAAERKRSLPPFPSRVGIVTSRSGAALQDFLHVLARRAPWVQVTLSSVRVQGEGASMEIAAAIREFNHFHELGFAAPEIIVVARGGGSAEDLWEFNEAVVARAIAASAIPVVSAVGHETDITIADLVADLRAPTPSAAAEVIAPDGSELQRRLLQTAVRLERHVRRRRAEERTKVTALQRGALERKLRRNVEEATQHLDETRSRLCTLALSGPAACRRKLVHLGALLRQHRPDNELKRRWQAIDSLRQRSAIAAARGALQRKDQIKGAANMLRLISPQAVLERGYTITSKLDGKIVRQSHDVAAGDRMTTRFADGAIEVEAKKARAETSSARA